MAVFLPAIAPVSLIILIGFLLGRFLTLDRQTLSKLAIYALSPALIGGNLYRSTLSVVSALKIILGFAIAFGITLLLQLESLESQVFVLQAAMPTAVNSLVFATEFGGDATRVAKTIVASTVLSLLTLPVVLTFLI